MSPQSTDSLWRMNEQSRTTDTNVTYEEDSPLAFDFSRRSLLSFGAGATIAGLGGCATAAQTTEASAAEAVGAFPAHKASDGSELLGPESGVALLSRNENPYGPAKSAKKGIAYAAEKGAYYPGVAYEELAKLIAERHGVTPDMIAITTGSGEALCAIALMYGPKGPIVAPRLFWDTTALYAQNLGMATISRVALTPDMGVDLAAIEAAVTPQTGLVQLCNPNNPTGMLSDPAAIKAAVTSMSKKTTVLVDEAYMELADDPDANTCIGLVKDGHDVIVSRTFSKIYGMAGIRVGYTIAAPETSAKIRSTAMSWIAGTGLSGAISCYNDMAFVDYSKSKVKEARDMITTTLDALDMTYLPSSTNFVYFKSGKPANDIQKALAEKQIMIRGQYMDYVDWSRVSMGKIADVERFCKALPTVV